jgi:hypothetical protein
MIDVSIGCMNLRLPPALQNRASAIAREVGIGLCHQLAGDLTEGFHFQQASLEHLDVPPLRLDPALSNRRLGMQIAAAICQQLRVRLAREM